MEIARSDVKTSLGEKNGDCDGVFAKRQVFLSFVFFPVLIHSAFDLIEKRMGDIHGQGEWSPCDL
jgi:hypothetical protein